MNHPYYNDPRDWVPTCHFPRPNAIDYQDIIVVDGTARLARPSEKVNQWPAEWNSIRTFINTHCEINDFAYRQHFRSPREVIETAYYDYCLLNGIEPIPYKIFRRFVERLFFSVYSDATNIWYYTGIRLLFPED